MLRRLIWLLLVLSVLAGLGWALWPRPVEVDTALIGPQDISVEVEETGRTRIREVFTVSAPIAGSMERLNLHAGDEVLAGQTVVARISPAAPALLDARARRIAEASRDAAEATVALVQAELARAEAQAAYPRSELARSGTLLDRGAIPTSAMEQARLDAAVAQAGVESARANLLVAQRHLWPVGQRPFSVEGEAAVGDQQTLHPAPAVAFSVEPQPCGQSRNLRPLVSRAAPNARTLCAAATGSELLGRGTEAPRY